LAETLLESTLLKVLHILSQVPAATGSGIYLQAALHHAALHDYQNYLLAGVPADYEDDVHLRKLASHDHCLVRFGLDLPFPIVGMSDVMPYPSTRFSDLSASELQLYRKCFESCLSDAVERWQPDLIHSHHLWLLTSLARQLFPQLPLLVSCHGSDLRQFINCPHLQQEVLAGCRQVDAVCALSMAQKADIEQLYGIETDKIHITGAGYDRKMFYMPAERQAGPVEIIYAGKLSRAKGVPWLLQALERLEAADFIFHLVGGGDGAEKAEILQRAKKLGSKVKIHGKLEQDRLAELMRQADLFVLPSFFEGLPLVLLEALACGCRLLATALPGCRELFSGIESEWVELVELPRMASIDVPLAQDEELFVATLQAGLQRQLAQLTKDRQQIFPPPLLQLLERQSWAGIFEKIEELYRQLVAK
jgi:glycosyltransferase involved in cell wall biosynthesis